MGVGLSRLQKRLPVRELKREPEIPPSLPMWQEALVGVEMLLLHATLVYYGIGVPCGDGSGVVLIPGFLANDIYLMEMFAWLTRLGYRPFYSGIGINADCPNLLISRGLNETIDRALRATKGKVHIIGHSLGGIIARSIAASRAPEIASVITLGAPFRGTAMHPRVRQMVELVRRQILDKHEHRVMPDCYTSHCTCSFLDHLRQDIPKEVGETAIYTRTDGLVDWQYCLTGNDDNDFEVTGTHLGLAFNPSVYRLIAHRLADLKSRPEI
jgi:pimeloyl-ACP methyl ester carboxylesterase